MQHKRRWITFLIFGLSLAAVMGIPLISPTLPVLQNQFGLTDFQTGLVITLYTVPAIFLAPLAGALADHYGRRKILIPSLVLYGFAGSTIYFLESFNLILGFRLIQGIGGTSLSLLARTLIGDYFSGRSRNKIMGFNDGILSLGATFFPFIGGYLGSVGWSLPYLLYLFPALLIPVAFLFLNAANTDKKPELISYTTAMGEQLRNPIVSLLMLGVFMDFVLLYGAIHTSLPLFYAQQFSLSAGSIGLCISFMSLMVALTSFMNGMLYRHFTSQALILFGFACYGAGLISIGMSSRLVFQMGSLLVFGAGHGLVLPTLNAVIIRMATDGIRASLLSVRTVMVRLGQTTGPLLFPLMTGVLSYSFSFVVVGIASLIIVVLIKLRLQCSEQNFNSQF